jgi:hypothetical protein
MKTNPDRLDDAIDLVTRRMTAVEPDAELATRIANGLPDRPTWLPRVWITRFAIGALATLAIGVVLRTFYEGSTQVLRREGANVPLAVVEPPSNDHRTPVESPVIVRRTTVEPSSNDRRTISEDDHEFSLAPIDAPDALLLTALAPSELASEPVQEIEPLQIADLPLSSDFSPR